MAKPLPHDDFRAARIVLEPTDFLVGSEIAEPPPRDLVSKETWQALVGLPDDVAIRTSNDYGGILKGASKFQSELVCVSIAMQELVKEAGREPAESPASYVLCNATDELAASIYNALTGYYGVSFSALRNVVENLTIGLYLELSNDVSTFESWLAGNDDLGFGWAADKASGNKTVREFETHLTARVADNFFRQKQRPDPVDLPGVSMVNCVIIHTEGRGSRTVKSGTAMVRYSCRKHLPNGPLFFFKFIPSALPSVALPSPGYAVLENGLI
jgi:hypothetical protein